MEACRQRRWVWRLLIVAEAANLADWLSTLIGVGGLGKPELNPAAVALMHAFGIFWGASLFKTLVAFELAGIAAGAVLLCERTALTGSWWPWAFLGVLMLAALALGTITVYNFHTILHAAD